MPRFSPDIRFLHLILSGVFGFLLASFLILKLMPDEVGGLLHESFPRLIKNHIHDIVAAAIYSTLSFSTLYFYQKSKELENNRKYYTEAIANGYIENFLKPVIPGVLETGAPMLLVLPSYAIMHLGPQYSAAISRIISDAGCSAQDASFNGRSVVEVFSPAEADTGARRTLCYVDVVRTLSSLKPIIDSNLPTRRGHPQSALDQRRNRLYDFIAVDFKALLGRVITPFDGSIKVISENELSAELARIKGAAPQRSSNAA